MRLFIVAAPLPWAVVYHTRQQVSLRMLETVHQVIVQLVVEYCAQQGYVFKRQHRGLCIVPGKARLAAAVGEIRKLVHDTFPLHWKQRSRSKH